MTQKSYNECIVQDNLHIKPDLLATACALTAITVHSIIVATLLRDHYRLSTRHVKERKL